MTTEIKTESNEEPLSKKRCLNKNVAISKKIKIENTESNSDNQHVSLSSESPFYPVTIKVEKIKDEPIEDSDSNEYIEPSSSEICEEPEDDQSRINIETGCIKKESSPDENCVDIKFETIQKSTINKFMEEETSAIHDQLCQLEVKRQILLKEMDTKEKIFKLKQEILKCNLKVLDTKQKLYEKSLESHLLFNSYM